MATYPPYYGLVDRTELSKRLNDELDEITRLAMISGEKGEKGDPGETGERGERGERGEPGIAGLDGMEGPQGPMGEGPSIVKTYRTVAELEADVNNPDIAVGNLVIISSDDPDNDPDNGRLYVKEVGEYRFLSILRGIRGETGARGEQGPRGFTGNDGSPGERGENGLRGLTGPKGEPGKITVKGSLGNVGLLPQTATSGDAYWINGELYVWSDDPLQPANAGFINSGSLIGPRGLEGPRGATGPSGSNTAVSNVAITHTSDFSALPQGTTISIRIPNPNSEEAIYYTDVINNLLGTTINYLNNFQYVITVHKQSAGLAIQKVEVYSYITGSGAKWYELTRKQSYNEFGDWNIQVVTNVGKSDPLPTRVAAPKTRYLNTTTNEVWVQENSSLSTYNWVKVSSSSKEYIHLTLNSNAVVANNAFIRWPAPAVNNGMTYNPSTGGVTLKAGKTYRVAFSLNATLPTDTTSQAYLYARTSTLTSTYTVGNKIINLTKVGSSYNVFPNSFTEYIIQPTSDLTIGMQVYNVANITTVTLRPLETQLTIIEL